MFFVIDQRPSMRMFLLDTQTVAIVTTTCGSQPQLPESAAPESALCRGGAPLWRHADNADRCSLGGVKEDASQ